MIDIRKQTFQALEQITLPEFLERINITLATPDIADGSADFQPVAGYYPLSNGININIPTYRNPFSVEFVDKNQEVHSVNKWFAYPDYNELKTIMEKSKSEPGLARDIDYACFDVFTQIVDALHATRNSIKAELFSTDVKSLYHIYNADIFQGLAIGHKLHTDGYEVNLDNIYTPTYISMYKVERIFTRDIKQPYRMLTDMFNSISIAATPIKRYQDLDSQQDSFVLSYRGFRYALPSSVLTDLGVQVGRCAISNELLVINTTNSTNLPRNIFGTNFPIINADIYVSTDALSDAVFHNSCDECGDDISVIESDFVEALLDVLPDGRDRDRIIDEIESYYTTDSYEDMCRSCSRRHRIVQADLEKIGIELQPQSKFTYKDTTYSLHEGSGVHDYDYKPDEFEFFYLPDESPTDLLLGVELEIDDGGENSSSARYITSILNKDITSDYTYCMHDGSLSDGFEIATMPSSLLFHMNKVNYEDSFKLASTMGYRSHDTSSCGLHVHMNRRFFGSSKATQNIKAAFMALILERNWDEVVKFSRRNYRHIEEWANKKGLEYEVNPSDTPDDIASKFLDSYDDKYVALNTMHRNSFELRIFRGTLRQETYIATLQFVSNLAHIAKSCTTLTRAQQISFSDIINYQRYPELTNYLATRGVFVESDDAPVIQAQPTLFDAVAQ